MKTKSSSLVIWCINMENIISANGTLTTEIFTMVLYSLVARPSFHVEIAVREMCCQSYTRLSFWHLKFR